jgi:hypothetical protein
MTFFKQFGLIVPMQEYTWRNTKRYNSKVTYDIFYVHFSFINMKFMGFFFSLGEGVEALDESSSFTTNQFATNSLLIEFLVMAGVVGAKGGSRVGIQILGGGGGSPSPLATGGCSQPKCTLLPGLQNRVGAHSGIGKPPAGS